MLVREDVGSRYKLCESLTYCYIYLQTLSVMARNTSLFLRIGEAKNLPVKDITGSSDPYCVITCDNEQVARTATVWRSLNPFWGEEYTLYLPNGFHHVNIYVYDQDTLSGDDLIGKVTLTKDMVQPQGDDQQALEQWLPLRRVSRSLEVRGELHLEAGRYSTADRHYLRLRVLEARDLAVVDHWGTADPYVVITFLDQTLQTQKIRGSLYPTWDASFDLEIPMWAELQEVVTVTVWDWDRIGGDDFMGQVEFQLNDLTLNTTFNQWFRLQPRNKDAQHGSLASQDTSMGTIRIRTRLREERILPSAYYQPLIELLMDSVSPEKHIVQGPTPLSMLREVLTLDLMEVANTLVKLYLGRGRLLHYLDVICTEEINTTSNPNTLFRGNSLATKSIDQFMKIVGMPYLQETLGPVVDSVFVEHRVVELDPARVNLLHSHRRSLKSAPSSQEVIEKSITILQRHLGVIKERIMASVPRMPALMRLVFNRLRRRIEERWPDPNHEDQKYVGVSGFLFLRFLAPAILSPKLFCLRDHHPDARTSRTLTLLAKTVQNMGNLGLQLGLGKERWMEPLHPLIRAAVPDVKRFIDSITEIDDSLVSMSALPNRSVFHPSVTIKQGWLWKRHWNKIKFVNSFTFKKRHFWLKHNMFAYAKKPTDQVRNTILTCDICAVERVDKHAFSRPNMGQVISCTAHGHLQILYFQAADVNEIHLWLSSLRKTILTNEVLLDFYHPGAFRHERWTCCSRPGQDAVGCSRTHSCATLGDWRDPLDPDAEAQIIYSQLITGRELLRQKYLESTEAVKETVRQQSLEQDDTLLCTSTSHHQGEFHRSTSFQDAQIASVAPLLDAIRDLEKAHEAFEKLEKERARHSVRGECNDTTPLAHPPELDELLPNSS